MGEFEFIRDHLAPLAGEGAHGLADDAARLPDLASGTWVISTDTSIEGVHFPRSVRGAAASERALRVAVSDLAAKAADPIGYFVNFQLPRDMEDMWLVALAQGLGDGQGALGCKLLGGDTTRHDGRLGITVTAVGRESRPLLRSGAQAGDDLWISGPVGDAMMGLRYLQGDMALPDPTGDDLYCWEEAFLRPNVRTDLREMLAEFATASIDVSDGLVADAGHIASTSGLGLTVHAEDVPLSSGVRRWVEAGHDHNRLVTALTHGDDYEVLFTAPAESGTKLQERGARASALQLPGMA